MLGLAAAGLAAVGAPSRPWLVGLAIVAFAFVGVLVAWAVVTPRRLAPPIPEQDLAKLTPKARLEVGDARLRLRHDLLNGRLQTLAVVAILAGAVLGYWQLAEDRSEAASDRELARQGQASERFTRAVNQLGDTQRVETRIGGIYGLAQVAEQAPDSNHPVGEVLLAYLNHQPRPKRPPTSPLSKRAPAPLGERAPDVQAVLTVLTQYDTDGDHTKDFAWLAGRIDLHALSLVHADLHGAFLGGADLRGADLRGADLRRVDLSGANLRGARANSRTMWPFGFDWRRAGVKPA